MIPAGGQVEHSEKVRRLAGGGEHRRRAALQFGDLRGYIIIGGVLQAGVKISAGFQVKQLPHVLPRRVFERGRLHDGNLPRLAVPRRVPALDALCFNPVIAHMKSPLHSKNKTYNIPMIFKRTTPVKRDTEERQAKIP